MVSSPSSITTTPANPKTIGLGGGGRGGGKGRLYKDKFNPRLERTNPSPRLRTTSRGVILYDGRINKYHYLGTWAISKPGPIWAKGGNIINILNL